MKKDMYLSDAAAILKIINIDTLLAQRCLKHDDTELAMEVLQRQAKFISDMLRTMEEA